MIITPRPAAAHSRGCACVHFAKDLRVARCRTARPTTKPFVQVLFLCAWSANADCVLWFFLFRRIQQIRDSTDRAMCGRCEKSGGLRAVCAGSRLIFGVPGLVKSLFSPQRFNQSFGVI